MFYISTAQLGDYEADLHGDDYMEELKFYPNQVTRKKVDLIES